MQLAVEDVMEIRKMLAQGKSQMNCARSFEIGKSTVRDIGNGRSWGWLEHLEPEDLPLIRQLVEDGVTFKDVADKFDLSVKQVSLITRPGNA